MNSWVHMKKMMGYVERAWGFPFAKSGIIRSSKAIRTAVDYKSMLIINRQTNSSGNT